MSVRFFVGKLALYMGLTASCGLYAQETPMLMTGKPVTGNATAKGGDLYQFIGLADTDVRLTATMPKGGVLTLYSPDGEEMTAVAGKDRIELKAILTDNAMYFVGVRAAQPGAAYTLRLKQRDIVSAAKAPAAAPAVPSQTPVTTTNTAPAADPAIWGVYARLVGQHRQMQGGYRLHWRWEVPQQVLVQEWVNPSTGQVAHTDTLRPGAAQGTLEMKSSHLGSARLGTVTPEGAVAFLDEGFFKPAYRALLAANGDFELQTLKLGGETIEVVDVQRFIKPSR